MQQLQADEGPAHKETTIVLLSPPRWKIIERKITLDWWKDQRCVMTIAWLQKY